MSSGVYVRDDSDASIADYAKNNADQRTYHRKVKWSTLSKKEKAILISAYNSNYKDRHSKVKYSIEYTDDYEYRIRPIRFNTFELISRRRLT